MIDLGVYTEQELFDAAVRGLASQNWEKSVVRQTCKYDNGKGRHCAVGWILVTFKIPLPQEFAWELLIGEREVTKAHRAFIKQLQSCHDMSAAGNDMKDAFITFAARRGLTFPEECL